MDRAAAIISAIRRESNTPHLGLMMGSNLNLTLFGSIGIASLTSPTVGDAQNDFMRNYHQQMPFCKWRLYVQEDRLFADFEVEKCLPDAEEVLIDAFMLTTEKMNEFLCSQAPGIQPGCFSLAPSRVTPIDFIKFFQVRSILGLKRIASLFLPP